MKRIEGALLPDTEVRWREDKAPLEDAEDYVWIVECSTEKDRGTVLWTKTTGLTSTVDGFSVSWMVGDLGSLEAQPSGKPKKYVLEFTGTISGKERKHQELLVIEREVA